MTVVLEGEVENLAMRMGDGGSNVASEIRPAVHHRLATYDDRGEVRPQLATALPSQEQHTWLVRPDGTMQTTYRLRPGVTWHDGTPLTVRDLVFAWNVTRDPDVRINNRVVASQIGRIETPSDSTLVLEWNNTYPFANALVEEDLGPLPVHLLEGYYAADKERFQQVPYWTTEFVGVGPFRLSSWERGSHLVLDAYDGFYEGRPKIDVLTVRFISDSATAVANLLAGAVDGSIADAIDFHQAMFVKQEWEQRGRKPTVAIQMTDWRLMSVQFREPKESGIRDVRVRRALLHGIDRDALVGTLLDGQAPVSHTFVTPRSPKWPWVGDVVAQYDYSPRRADALLRDVGWRRGDDGMFMNGAGEKVTVPIWTTSGEQSEQELAIIGDSWKALGVQVEEVVLPRAQARDNQLRASFPGFDITTTPLKFSPALRRVYGPDCPTERTRWTGTNRGCYQNPELDRIVDGLLPAIEESQQRQLYRALVKLHTEELPVLPLYFDVQATTFREGVVGINPGVGPDTPVTWNAAEWDIP